jgi:hypothetical protein
MEINSLFLFSFSGGGVCLPVTVAACLLKVPMEISSLLLLPSQVEGYTFLLLLQVLFIKSSHGV